MRIIDAHCDLLLKMVEDDTIDFYKENEHVHVHFNHLNKSNVILQVFALFVPPSTPPSNRFSFLLRMIDAFYERIIRKERMQLISTADDLEKIFFDSEQPRGGLLSLEGAEALEGSLVHLRMLYRLGLRALGFTWNHRNEAADGVEEPNPGGLSQFGRSLLRESNRLGILLDVSHLSQKGFWDVIEQSSAPILASHSNCNEVYPHPRNLTDAQIRAVIEKNGVIGLTFVPQFISGKEEVGIKDLLHHVDHVLSLGGEDHLAFGSDFDGITETMVDIRHAGHYNKLIEELLKYHKEDQVEKWLNKNWKRLFMEVL